MTINNFPISFSPLRIRDVGLLEINVKSISDDGQLSSLPGGQGRLQEHAALIGMQTDGIAGSATSGAEGSETN